MNKNKKTLILTALVGLTLGASALVSHLPILTDLRTSVLPTVLVNLSNTERLAADLPALEINSKLQKAAQLKADDMAKRGYFSHYTPEGDSPWTWLDGVKYDYLTAGENLAVNFDESADVDKAWMNSPKHRDNILNKKFTQIGIATAKGQYKGADAVFVVQFFGKPAMPAI